MSSNRVKMLSYLHSRLPSMGNKFQQSVLRNVIKLNVSKGGKKTYKELSQLSNPSTITCPMRHEGDLQVMRTNDVVSGLSAVYLQF